MTGILTSGKTEKLLLGVKREFLLLRWLRGSKIKGEILLGNILSVPRTVLYGTTLVYLLLLRVSITIDIVVNTKIGVKDDHEPRNKLDCQITQCGTIACSH